MTDVIIIGAGLIGMLCARECAQAGLQVTMLERGQPLSESSWAGGGILSPLYPWRYPDSVNHLAQWSQAHYAGLCAELEEATGIDPQYTRSGLLVLDTDEQTQARRWSEQFCTELEGLASDEVQVTEPALGLRVEHALWMPTIAQVRNPRLGKALRRDLELRGVDIRSEHEVTRLSIAHDRISAVETRQGIFRADRVIVASGAWSRGVLGSTGLALPVEPVRGQMVMFRARPGQVTRMSLYQGHYVIPRRDGHVLAGSTLEYVGFDKTTTSRALDALRDMAISLIPLLREAPIERHWAGLRPGADQGVPFIGPHPQVENLFINAGHFRNGVVLGLASARLLGDLCLGRQPILDPSAYLPELERLNTPLTRG